MMCDGCPDALRDGLWDLIWVGIGVRDEAEHPDRQKSRTGDQRPAGPLLLNNLILYLQQFSIEYPVSSSVTLLYVGIH